MKGFRGWQVVRAAAGIQLLQAGLLHHAFGAYLAVLHQERGWSRSALSGAAAMQSLEGALLGPLVGWIIDRFGPLGVIRAGLAMFALGFMVLSQIDSLLGFYGAVFIIAIGASMCGYLALMLSVIEWFERKRSRALSFVAGGLAVGGVFVPLVAWSMQTWGWRFTAFASGVLVILVGWPLSGVFRHRRLAEGEPMDGLAPPTAAQAAADGVPTLAATSTGAPAAAAAAGTVRSTAPAPRPQDGYTAREALRTRTFWLLAVAHGLALLVVTAVTVHAINHMTQSLQYSVTKASTFIMLMTGFQIVGVLLAGWLGDQVEKRLLCALTMLLHAGGMLCLTFAGSAGMLVLFAVLHGTAWGMRGPLMHAIRADYYGRRAIGVILGLSASIIVIGQVGGPMIAGVLADMTGDYRLGFVVLASLAGAGSVLFLLAVKPPDLAREAAAHPEETAPAGH